MAARLLTLKEQRELLQKAFDEVCAEYSEDRALTFDSRLTRPPWYKRWWHRLFPERPTLTGFGAPPEDKQ
jgi:hypothetical protein